VWEIRILLFSGELLTIREKNTLLKDKEREELD
jgi:hypothetical protein